MLTSISATARPDNPGSFETLEKLGFVSCGVEEKHGARRKRYLLELAGLTSLPHRIAEVSQPPLLCGLATTRPDLPSPNAVSASKLGPLTIRACSTVQISFQGRFGDGALVPLQERHIGWIYENLFRDKEVLRWYRNGQGRTREETQRFVCERARAWQTGFIGGWLVCVDEGPAGYFGCERYDETQLEIGYAFAPQFWGRGLASACVSSVLRYFQDVETPFASVIATAHPNNVASQAVPQKAGFVYTKTSPRTDYDGCPRHYYAWIRPAAFMGQPGSSVQQADQVR